MSQSLVWCFRAAHEELLRKKAEVEALLQTLEEVHQRLEAGELELDLEGAGEEEEEEDRMDDQHNPEAEVRENTRALGRVESVQQAKSFPLSVGLGGRWVVRPGGGSGDSGGGEGDRGERRRKRRAFQGDRRHRGEAQPAAETGMEVLPSVRSNRSLVCLTT